jgi:hypothetical protein
MAPRHHERFNYQPRAARNLSAAVTNATFIPLTVHWSPIPPTVPGPLHSGRARHGRRVKTRTALRFRLKLGCATFRCGLYSAKRAVPPSAALPLANIQTEADAN